jgi:hypothetical protein
MATLPGDVLSGEGRGSLEHHVQHQDDAAIIFYAAIIEDNATRPRL